MTLERFTDTQFLAAPLPVETFDQKTVFSVERAARRELELVARRAADGIPGERRRSRERVRDGLVRAEQEPVETLGRGRAAGPFAAAVATTGVTRRRATTVLGGPHASPSNVGSRRGPALPRTGDALLGEQRL